MYIHACKYLDYWAGQCKNSDRTAQVWVFCPLHVNIYFKYQARKKIEIQLPTMPREPVNFSFLPAPTEVLLGNVVATVAIRGQTQTKHAWIPEYFTNLCFQLSG